MTETSTQLPEHQDAVRRAFDRFVPLAIRGLERMIVPEGDVFCFKAFAGATDTLRLEGRSERYSSMSLIGLASIEQRGDTASFAADAIADHLHTWAPTAPDLGDAGLVLWTELLRKDGRAEATAAAILGRAQEVFDPKYALASMETGFLLLGLAHARQAGLGGTALETFARQVAGLLGRNQNAETGLFGFARKLRRKNIHRARVDSRLGSFASQVYPTMAFAALAQATGDDAYLATARRCADRIAELQGPQGQWWWVYHRNRATPAIRYPVYTVHQDAMGPMMLLATALADGGSDRYDEAVRASFAWFDDRPECADEALIDDERGVVWRAVQHDDPATTGRLGLAAGEIARMGRSVWLGTPDTREFGPGFVCPECRPYHLGWILLAAALWAERLEQR